MRNDYHLLCSSDEGKTVIKEREHKDELELDLRHGAAV